MPPLLIATVPPPPEVGGADLLAVQLLGIARWPIPRWMRPREVTPSDVLSAYVDIAYLWPEYTKVRPRAEARARANALRAPGRVAVLLGRETQLAFRDRVSFDDFFQWEGAVEGDEVDLYGLLPYPMAGNRLWNYRENRRIGRQMLDRARSMGDEHAA